jgi:hypothetical protein
MRTGHGDGHYRVCDAAGQASSATAAEGTRQRPCTESARDASPTENPREARTCLRGDESVERASEDREIAAEECCAQENMTRARARTKMALSPFYRYM